MENMTPQRKLGAPEGTDAPPLEEGKPISPDFQAAFEASFKRNEEALRRLAKL